jgi:transcriptional regulator with XRE-family HTH domain
MQSLAVDVAPWNNSEVVMPHTGPTIVRRQLGRRLRLLRESAGKKERDVVDAKLASRQKLWRIENGKTPVKVSDVRSLCWLYRADEETADALAKLAEGTSGQGWTENHGDSLPEWFGLYVGLEAMASEIRSYDPELVHGLLQTPSYTRAVTQEGNPEIGSDVVDRQITVRGERQHMLLTRMPPIRLTVILGAGVLTRPVGGRRVMAEQIARLKELNGLDHLDVRVLPWKGGAHAAMHVGAFSILDFADPDDPPVVYLESHTGAQYLEKKEELVEYRKVFDLIQHRTTSIEEYRP